MLGGIRRKKQGRPVRRRPGETWKSLSGKPVAREVPKVRFKCFVGLFKNTCGNQRRLIFYKAVSGMRAFSGPVSGAGDFFRLSGGGEARPGISPSFPPFLARRWRPWRRISGKAVPGFHHPRRREALGGGAEAVPLEARMRTKFRTGGFCGFLSKTGAGEVNRRNLREALRKGIGTDRRFAPSEGFRKGSDGMASATPHPVSGISELRENRISRTSDSRRADLFLHRPREKPRRGRLPPLSVSHGGNGAPGGARRMRPSASMRNGSAPRSGSRR